MTEHSKGPEITANQTYMQYDGQVINYSSELHLPPDKTSELLARDRLTKMTTYYRYLKQEADAPLRILIPGIGPGTLACGFLEGLSADPNDTSYNTPKNVHITAFDISIDAVEAATENIGRHIRTKWGEDSPVTFDVFQGNWNDQKVWDKLKEENKFTHVIVNPPYARVYGGRNKENFRPGYENVPETTLFGGEDGADHYRTIAPHIPSILSEDEGAGIFYRLPLLDSQPVWSPIPAIVTAPFQAQGKPFYYDRWNAEWMEWREQRMGTWITIERTTDESEDETMGHLHGSSVSAIENNLPVEALRELHRAAYKPPLTQYKSQEEIWAEDEEND